MMSTLVKTGSLNPMVQALASTMDQMDPVGSVNQWCRRAFTYRDEDKEVLRTPEYMANEFLTTGGTQGDCDDMSIMACCLFRCMGIPTRLTAIKSDNPDEFDHVFSEARIGENWIPVDPTVPEGTIYTHYGMVHEPC